MLRQRYADSAKQIVCRAKVNEDPNAKLIRELKGGASGRRASVKASSTSGFDLRGSVQTAEHVAKLWSGGWQNKDENGTVPSHSPEICQVDENGDISSSTRVFSGREEETLEQIKTSEKLIAELNESWEDKLKKTEAMK